MTAQDALGPVDTAFLFVEKPETPMNIGAITTFEGDIDFDSIVELIDSRLHEAPLYQKKVIQSPLNVGQPYWAFDPEFHIRNHVLHRQLDSPGSDAQLQAMLGELISQCLDRSKPLWEIYVINGLAENRTGVFFKVHHCMVDGLSAVELFTMLLDFTPEVREAPRKPLFDPPYLPNKIGITVEAIQNDLPYKFNILQKIGDDLSNIGKILSNKEKRRSALMGIANLVNDNLRPISKLAINGKNTGNQSLAWAEFSLAEVRAMRSDVRGSVNDVMLTVLASGLGKYQRDYGDFVDQNFIRILIPVNMRIEQDKNTYGNRVSVLPIDVPLETKNPLDRLKSTVKYTRTMKDSSLSTGLDLILTLPSLAPAITQPLIWGSAPLAFSILAHTWCTNVAGPQIPMYLLGHQMLSSRGFFPLNPSMGLACVVTSYNQHITMTLIADKGIVPNVALVAGYLEEAYHELRQAAKVKPIMPVDVKPVEITPSKPQIPPTDKPEESHSDEETPVVEKETTDSKTDENGSKPEASTAQQTPKAPQKPKNLELFSEDWAQAYQKAINANPAYLRASTRWRAGSLAFIIQPDASRGFDKTAAVLMDLHQGECRSAHSITPAEARYKAAFVIEGDYATWMQVLNGKAAPLAMIMRRKLRLSKGSITQLLPFTQSAQELVNSAQTIS